MNSRRAGTSPQRPIRCSNVCDVPPVNTRTILRTQGGHVLPSQLNLAPGKRERRLRTTPILRASRPLRSLSVRAALARLAFANEHQATCSFVGLDMSDVRHLLEGRKVCTLRAACSTSADLPRALNLLLTQNKQAFNAATSAVAVMTSGYGRIFLSDIGATWRILRANPPGIGNTVYATCTHPTFGASFELVVLLAYARKLHANYLNQRAPFS